MHTELPLDCHCITTGLGKGFCKNQHGVPQGCCNCDRNIHICHEEKTHDDDNNYIMFSFASMSVISCFMYIYIHINDVYLICVSEWNTGNVHAEDCHSVFLIPVQLSCSKCIILSVNPLYAVLHIWIYTYIWFMYTAYDCTYYGSLH